MTQREPISTDRAPAAMGAYSQAIRAGGLIFTAGQGGLDPATRTLVEGGAAAEAERALQNIRAVLEAAGSGMTNVVKVTLFLTDMADFTSVNEVYRRHFSEPYPARSTVAVRELPGGFSVEIECIALAP